MLRGHFFDYRKKGMDHMLGKGWRDLFDIIITQARKPSFYHQPASRFVCVFVCFLLLLFFMYINLGFGAANN